MFGYSIANLVGTLLTFYYWIILAYVLLSWFRPSGAIYDIYRVLAQLAEPYLSLFRRWVPVTSGLDFSPLVALIVLSLIRNVVVRALGAAGL